MNDASPQLRTRRRRCRHDCEDFDALDDILDDLRTRYDETPQWEFCEGFMAALICCRRLIMPSEYLPVLLATDDGRRRRRRRGGALPTTPSSPGSWTLWTRRWNEVATALDAPIEALDDERAYAPRGDGRARRRGQPARGRARRDRTTQTCPPLPRSGRWASCSRWRPGPRNGSRPRDKKIAKLHDAALEAIVALTEDDEEEPTLSALSEDGPPSVSVARLNAYGDALWAVYDLREIWRDIGARVETVRARRRPGRNDPCSCGSGKKYKKCCGA